MQIKYVIKSGFDLNNWLQLCLYINRAVFGSLPTSIAICRYDELTILFTTLERLTTLSGHPYC